MENNNFTVYPQTMQQPVFFHMNRGLQYEHQVQIAGPHYYHSEMPRNTPCLLDQQQNAMMAASTILLGPRDILNLDALDLASLSENDRKEAETFQNIISLFNNSNKGTHSAAEHVNNDEPPRVLQQNPAYSNKNANNMDTSTFSEYPRPKIPQVNGTIATYPDSNNTSNNTLRDSYWSMNETANHETIPFKPCNRPFTTADHSGECLNSNTHRTVSTLNDPLVPTNVRFAHSIQKENHSPSDRTIPTSVTHNVATGSIPSVAEFNERGIISVGYPHGEAVDKNGKALCIPCNKMFTSNFYLGQHNNAHHSGEKLFKCPKCGKKFPTKETCHMHFAKHNDVEKKFKCHICSRQFMHKFDMTRHIFSHKVKPMPYACRVCEKGFARRDHLGKHERSHRPKATAIKGTLDTSEGKNN